MACNVRWEAERIPLGTSVIAQEFSAGKPEPTLLDKVKQQTTDDVETALLQNEQQGHPQQEQSGRNKRADNNALYEVQQKLQELLAEELKLGSFELDHHGQQLNIRIQEHGTFASGSAYLAVGIGTKDCRHWSGTRGYSRAGECGRTHRQQIGKQRIIFRHPGIVFSTRHCGGSGAENPLITWPVAGYRIRRFQAACCQRQQ